MTNTEFVDLRHFVFLTAAKAAAYDISVYDRVYKTFIDDGTRERTIVGTNTEHDLRGFSGEVLKQKNVEKQRSSA